MPGASTLNYKGGCVGCSSLDASRNAMVTNNNGADVGGGLILPAFNAPGGVLGGIVYGGGSLLLALDRRDAVAPPILGLIVAGAAPLLCVDVAKALGASYRYWVMGGLCKGILMCLICGCMGIVLCRVLCVV